MSLVDVDARIVTAFSLCLIGTIVCAFTAKVWWTHPVNRSLLFGPYLTPLGLEVMLKGWPMLFLLGLLAITGGVSRFIHWLRWRHLASDELASAAGLVEAAFSLWAAGALVIFAVKTWHHWKRL